MNDITYIFGAGASCQAMPLVENFTLRFGIFKKWLMSDQNIYEIIKEDLEEFLGAIESHLSFDTYFKKLFHQGKTDLIEKGKKVLVQYFLFEHLLETDTFRVLSSNIDIPDSAKKKFKVDPRYDALIAGLLKPIPAGTRFHTKINFITWNYDTHLITALKNFLAPQKTFTEFIEKYHGGISFGISEEVKLFHLNGFINHPTLNTIPTAQNLLNYRSHSIGAETNELKAAAKEIKFAWEQDLNFGILQNCIKNSNTVIMVGYSLPLYNREIDTAYLSQEGLFGKTLIIQNKNPKDIADVLAADFNISQWDEFTPEEEKITIKQSSNCNSFIIPSYIFAKK